MFICGSLSKKLFFWMQKKSDLLPESSAVEPESAVNFGQRSNPSEPMEYQMQENILARERVSQSNDESAIAIIERYI